MEAEGEAELAEETRTVVARMIADFHSRSVTEPDHELADEIIHYLQS